MKFWNDMQEGVTSDDKIVMIGDPRTGEPQFLKLKDVKPSDVTTSSHLIELGIYSNIENIVPDNSRFDSETNITVDSDGKGIRAGDWEIRYPLDINNYVSKENDKFIVSLNTTGGHNPSIWLLNKIDRSLRGLNLSMSFTVKMISGNSNSLYVNLGGDKEEFIIISLDETEQRINTNIVFGDKYEDDRFMFFLFTEIIGTQNLVLEISNVELKLKNGIIQESKQNAQSLQSLGEYTSNIISDNSLLDAQTELITNADGKGIRAGDWEIRYPLDANNKIKKLENSFSISISDTGGSNSAFWLLDKISNEYKGRSFRIKFEIKKLGGNVDNISLLLNGNQTQTLNIPLTNQFQVIDENILFGNTYQDNRLMFFIPSPKDNGLSSQFEIRNILLSDVENTLVLDYKKFKIEEDQKHQSANAQISSVEDRMNVIEQTKGVNLTLPNYLAKAAQIERNGVGVINFMEQGDSWAMGVGENGSGLIGYCKYQTRMLQKKYGYAGLGWFDFARVNGTDMECADDEMTIYTPSGAIQYVDKTPEARGLPFAHAVMNRGASFSIVISEEAPTDKANILFDKNAKFSVSVNGGAAIEVNANNTDNWQNYLIEDNITSIVITALSDNTIVYGIDFSYGNKGVKVHKVGCRGLNTRQPLKVDIDNWITGLSKLNIDVYSILLGTNDRTLNIPPSESASNIEKIINNVKVAHPYIDYLITCPSETKGGTGKYDIREYGLEFSKVALNNNLTYLNLYSVFGTSEQINHLNTFEDPIHPNNDGGYMIGLYKYKMLFEYENFILK